MEGQLVRLEQLPSKGKVYPDDIEIYIKPLSIKEQMDMDRYGISQAEYYTQAIQGITIRGNFDRNNLLFHDVQFMDLVRVLYTFDVSNPITACSYPCNSCGETFDYSFKLDEIEFTDIDTDLFGEDGSGTSFTFSDETCLVIKPFTVGDYIKVSRKYLSNKKLNATEIYLIYMSLCVNYIKDRSFKDFNAQFEFVRNYIGSLSMYVDRKLLLDIEDKCTSIIEPFKTVCPKCGEEVSVIISPRSQFRQ